MYESARERMLEFCDEGILLWEDVAIMALKIMSEQQIRDMIRLNELNLEDEEVE